VQVLVAIGGDPVWVFRVDEVDQFLVGVAGRVDYRAELAEDAGN
jgi:hypothetical protein